MSDYRLLAPVYDRLARLVFGRTLQDAKARFFGTVRPGEAVLVLGGGTGDGIRQLAALPGVQIDFVEPCTGMIRRAARRLPGHLRHKVRFIQGDHRTLDACSAYDVVVTHFVLDGMGPQETQDAMQRLAGALRAGGRWLIADFFDSGRRGHRLLTRMMYLFFRCTARIGARELPDFDSLFCSQNLFPAQEQRYLHGFVRSRVYLKPGYRPGNRKTGFGPTVGG